MKHFTLTPKRMRPPLPCEEPTQEEYDAFWKRKGCIPMPHDKTLLEIMGIGPASIGDEYCKIVNTYLRGHISESEKRSRIDRLGRL